MTTPSVFISYSHDSPEHADRVLEFANRLVDEGIDVILDQYEPAPAEGWPRWMDRHIRSVDFVLMVCTETYFRRVMDEEEIGKGLGVKWEGNLIYQHIYNADTRNTRFIPGLFKDCRLEHIPTPLQGATHYRLDTPKGYEDLYRRITKQPLIKKPKLGKLHPLPPRERKDSKSSKVKETMSTPTVFISYSYKDESWKERVVTHLRVLRGHSQIELWDDRQIGIGPDWYEQIQAAITKANVAVLLVSANFLSSEFILDEEVPRLLERQKVNDLHIIPLIIRPCAWRLVGWLQTMQPYPRGVEALSACNQHKVDENLAAVVERIYDILSQARAKAVTTTKVSFAKLPVTDTYVFGREEELRSLDSAWDSQDVNIVTLVAWGGVGKTALVNKWLSQMARDSYRGAECVFGWSFYSQGAAEGRQVSADHFITAALAWFGDPDPMQGSAWDKGERLAELIRGERTLLVLDGLEPLQNPSPVETGKIKDPGLVALLRELAQRNLGLVIITTRLAVDDLEDFKGSTAMEIDLENLSPEAGAAVLERLGVNGTDEEYKEAARDFGGHALALTLMGRYLKVMHHGDIRKRREIPHMLDEQKQVAHAQRVMESYEQWLKGKPELDILRLMSLFDRPAEKGALEVLRKEPGIEGLNDALQELKDADWQFAVENLRDLGLIARPSISPLWDSSQSGVQDPELLDCHPLLREHFGEKLKANNPKAWREAHGRLYEYYKSSAKEYPDTIEEMAPLYAAVVHGCEAGRHLEAFLEVYLRRIQRGEQSFNKTKLGAFGSEVSVLSGFFDPPWRLPVPTLREDIKGYILNEAGADLRALGRLVEAAQPMLAALETDIAHGAWRSAATDATNLSELYLTIGDVAQALDYARQSVELADHTGDAFERLSDRATLGDVLHQSGHLSESESTFREAEEMLVKSEPHFPILYGVSGSRYYDLLLTQGKYQEVQRRAGQTLEWETTQNWLLDIALDNLSLGRAHMLQSQHESNHPLTEATNHLNRAVDGLRQAGTQHHLPRGLLARAELLRVSGVLEKAQRDLDEAFSIATRSGMGLYLADCHLEYARLWLARGEKEKAREHLSIAKQMIDKMGYHRRDGAVKELQEQL